MNYLSLTSRNSSLFTLNYIVNYISFNVVYNVLYVKCNSLSKEKYFRRCISSESNPYKVLGISNRSSHEEIKKKFCELAKKYHPDLNPSIESKNEMSKILSAYEILSDPVKRKKYDESSNLTSGKNFHFDSNIRFVDDAWIFNSFRDHINLMKFFGNFASRNNFYRTNFMGSNINHFIEIDFFDAINGVSHVINTNLKFRCNKCDGNGSIMGSSFCPYCKGIGISIMKKKSLTIYSQCENCSGVGYIKLKCRYCNGAGAISKPKKVSLVIPKGTKTGKEIRVIGEGNYGPGGYGDLIVIVNVIPHPKIRWINNDVHVNINVPLKTIIFGGEISIPSIRVRDKLLKLFIPPNTNPRVPFVLKKKGPPIYGSEDFGDYIIHFSAEISEKDIIEKNMCLSGTNNNIINSAESRKSENKKTIHFRYNLVSKVGKIFNRLIEKLY